MRCGAWVRPGSLKGERLITEHYRIVEGTRIPEDFVQCDGKIGAEAKVFYDHDVNHDICVHLRIDYQCEKCGNVEFLLLPGGTHCNTLKEVSEFLTEQIEGLPESYRQRRLRNYRESRERKTG